MRRSLRAANLENSPDLRQVLHAVAANMGELIHADAVVVALLDAAQEEFRVLAMDFPHGKGIIKAADVNADYTIRPEPSESLRQLRTLTAVI